MSGGARPFTAGFSQPSVASIRYNTSQAGTPIPLVYGTTRVAINLLEAFGFSGSGGGAGKGGGGSKKSSANYVVDCALALCQGPVTVTGAPLGLAGFNRVWSNGGISNFNRIGINFYQGSDGQAPDPTFLTEDPNSPVIGYSGTAYVTGTPLELGATPALPNIGFEISGFGCVTMGGTGCGPDFPGDANPAYIVADMLTNARYGAGLPSANLDTGGTLPVWGTFCQAASLAMSLLLDRTQPAATWLKQICDLTVSAPVWSGATLKIIPYWLGAYSNNGASWSPNLTVQYSVDDDDIVPWQGDARSSSDTGSDPVVPTRVDPAQITNWLSLEYYDTYNSFNPALIPYYDQGAIDTYGVRTEPSKEAHCFTNVTSAYSSAFLQVNRGQWNRNSYKFQLPWRFCLLEPMDVIEVTDPGAGLNATPVRITEITETDNGELQITAEGLPGIASSAPAFGGGATAGAPLDLYAAPGNVNAPVIFEPPLALSGGGDEVVIAASGGSEWGGCQVWVSTDGSTYKQVGTITGAARQGVLSASLPTFAGSPPDTADTLAVDLTESDGQLVSASAGDAANFVTLCYVDGELVSYETATLTGTSLYNLTTLYRGAYGSAISAHANGSPFAFVGLPLVGSGIFVYPYPSNLIGQTLYIKLLSFNLFGEEVQELSAVTAYQYLLNGSGSGNVLALLAAGNNEDWGTVSSTLVAEANLGVVSDTLAGTIALGSIP